MPSGLSQDNARTDGSDQYPFNGIATAAIGALGMLFISPLVVAVTPSEFFDDIGLQSFVIGLVVAILVDYTLCHLTDDGSHWPKLPVWITSLKGFMIALAISSVAFLLSLIPAPSWVPVVAIAIGGMQSFATASVAALILGGAHSAVWMIGE